jgi:two-component system NtrC family sensor kinase
MYRVAPSMPTSKLLTSPAPELNAELQLILDATVEGICGVDAAGNATFCNDALLKMTGYQADELIGSNLYRLLHRGQPENAKCSDGECVFRKVNDGNNTVHIVGELLWRKDGTSFPVEYRALPPRPSATQTAYVVAFQDLTEQQRRGEVLRQGEAKFRRILISMPDVVWTSNQQGRMIYISPKVKAIFGYTKREICASDELWMGRIHSDDSVRVKLAYRALFERQLPFDQEFRIRRKDEEWIWVHVRAMGTHLDNGFPNTDGVLSDITRRKHAEEQLVLAQFSLEHASDAIFRVDPTGRIVYVNGKACHVSERSREELLSLTIPEIDPLFSKETWEVFWKDIKVRGAITVETLHQAKHGRVFPVEVTANYVKLDAQEYAFSFVRDLSERHELESQLRHAQKLESIGQLAAGIAHEINTPTQFVMDNLKFLRDSWKGIYELLERYRTAIRDAALVLPPRVTADLTEAERNVDLEFLSVEGLRAIDQSLEGAGRVAEIVRAMKEFSHPDSANKTPTDINRAIESTITVARSEWRYVAEIVTEFDQSLPPVVCHPGDINQVILNLVVNAAHAIHEKAKDGEKGRITVRTKSRGEFIEVAITDTGVGIPEKIRNRIFDPFFTTKDVGKGTGQGLSLAHRVVVKKHGGRIWFETETGIGTTFFIQLPFDPAHSPEES